MTVVEKLRLYMTYRAVYEKAALTIMWPSFDRSLLTALAAWRPLLHVADVHDDCITASPSGWSSGRWEPVKSFINKVSSCVIWFPNNYPAHEINNAISNAAVI